MKSSTHNKKKEQLGEDPGTASHKLKKLLFFRLVQECNLDICIRCNTRIQTAQELSIDHIEPWLDSENPSFNFYNLENIGYSHLKCNIGSTRFNYQAFSERKDTRQNIRLSKVLPNKFTNLVGVHTYGKDRQTYYKARITHEGKTITIGCGSDPIVLAKLYDDKVLELFGNQAVTNRSLGLV